jgi:DNA-binding HxlR family transcriptional regulator
VDLAAHGYELTEEGRELARELRSLNTWAERWAERTGP